MLGLPTWAIRLLPHLAVALAVIGAYLWIDHKGYQRAQKDAQFERAVNAAMLARTVREIDTRTAARLSAIADNVHGQISTMRATNTTIIEPTVTKELAREARYSDPLAGISDLLREQFNRTYSAIACSSGADGRISCALPPATPAGKQ